MIRRLQSRVVSRVVCFSTEGVNNRVQVAPILFRILDWVNENHANVEARRLVAFQNNPRTGRPSLPSTALKMTVILITGEDLLKIPSAPLLLVGQRSSVASLRNLWPDAWVIADPGGSMLMQTWITLSVGFSSSEYFQTRKVICKDVLCAFKEALNVMKTHRIEFKSQRAEVTANQCSSTYMPTLASRQLRRWSYLLSAKLTMIIVQKSGFWIGKSARPWNPPGKIAAFGNYCLETPTSRVTTRWPGRGGLIHIINFDNCDAC